MNKRDFITHEIRKLWVTLEDIQGDLVTVGTGLRHGIITPEMALGYLKSCGLLEWLGNLEEMNDSDLAERFEVAVREVLDAEGITGTSDPGDRPVAGSLEDQQESDAAVPDWLR